MPTFAKAMAGLLFAVLAWYVSEMIKPRFPEGMNTGYFSEVNAALAFIVAWLVIGSRAGRGYANAVGFGLTGAVAVVFWCLFAQSFGEMIRLSLRKYYDSAPEAVVAVFELMVENGRLMSTPEIWGWLLGGGVVIALLVESVARRYD